MKFVSKDLKDLISRILVSANDRISIDEIIAHHWLNH